MKRIQILVILKRLHGLPKIGKALVDGLPIIGQLHLKLAFQHIKLEKVF